MRRLIYILLFVPLACLGQSTWHVSQSGNNETGDGSAEFPFANISTANGWADTGDTIKLIGGGTITEAIQSTIAVGIHLISDDGNTLTANAALNPILRFVSTAGNAVDGDQIIRGINFDGDETAVYRAIDIYYRSNVTLEDCTFTGFLYNAVRWHGTTSAWNVTPSNTLPTGNKMINCSFDNCTQYAGSGETGHVRISGQVGFLWQGGSLTQYNANRDAGENRDLAGGYQNYGLNIIGVTWTKEDTNDTEWNFFAEFHYSHGGFYMYDCTFNGAACFDLSGVVRGTYDYGAWIEGNTFTTASSPVATSHDEPYLDLESFDEENDITVIRNRFNNSRTAIKLVNIQTSAARINIDYNIFENVGNTTNAYSNAILVQSNWADTDPIPMREIRIRNNVMEAGQASYAGILVSVWGDIDVMDIDNNIIYGVFGRPIRFIRNGGTPTVDSLNVRSNCFYGNTSTAAYYDGNITFTNDTESGNITTDPLFVSSSDFSLQESSPCIDAGVDVGLSSDYLGRDIVGLPDIGAYEWGNVLYVRHQGHPVYHLGKKVIIYQ